MTRRTLIPMAKSCLCWVGTWGHFAEITKRLGAFLHVPYGTAEKGKTTTSWLGACGSMATFLDTEVTCSSLKTLYWRRSDFRGTAEELASGSMFKVASAIWNDRSRIMGPLPNISNGQ